MATLSIHKEKEDMTIGDRIRARREELGMSQSDLARKAGYKSRSSINKIENDDRGATRENLISIAKALRVTPSYLMGWEHNHSDNTGQQQATADNTKTVDFTGLTC